MQIIAYHIDNNDNFNFTEVSIFLKTDYTNNDAKKIDSTLLALKLSKIHPLDHVTLNS